MTACGVNHAGLRGKVSSTLNDNSVGTHQDCLSIPSSTARCTRRYRRSFPTRSSTRGNAEEERQNASFSPFAGKLTLFRSIIFQNSITFGNDCLSRRSRAIIIRYLQTSEMYVTGLLLPGRTLFLTDICSARIASMPSSIKLKSSLRCCRTKIMSSCGSERTVQSHLQVSKRNIGMHSRFSSCRVLQCCSVQMQKHRIQAESLRSAYPQEIAVVQSPSGQEPPAVSSSSS